MNLLELVNTIDAVKIAVKQIESNITLAKVEFEAAKAQAAKVMSDAQAVVDEAIKFYEQDKSKLETMYDQLRADIAIVVHAIEALN